MKATGTLTYPPNFTQVIGFPSFQVKKRGNPNTNPQPIRWIKNVNILFLSAISQKYKFIVYLPNNSANKLFIPDRLYRIQIGSFLSRIPAEKDSGHRTDRKRQNNGIQLDINRPAGN